VRKQRGNRG